MGYRGIARGKTIELEEALPYPEGQRLNVRVEPEPQGARRGSPEAIRQAMRQPPHLDEDAVRELEEAIHSRR